jgi:hypothetical protein
MRRAVVLAALLAALALGGCGADYPDLFVLSRSGSLPGAKLTLFVNDGGTVRCNGGAPKRLPDALLLDARQLAKDLEEEAHEGLTLPRSPRALLRFRLRTQFGIVRFGDVDAVGRRKLGQVVAFARNVARDVCGLPR